MLHLASVKHSQDYLFVCFNCVIESYAELEMFLFGFDLFASCFLLEEIISIQSQDAGTSF